MRTAGVVVWFDRVTGTGEVALDDGGEHVRVCLAESAAAPATGGVDLRADARTPRAGVARGLDVAAAYRAGTWGDGGRDY